MLVSAFFSNRNRSKPFSQMKAWSYVGRFVWGFAMIENTVNQLFCELIGGPQSQLKDQQRRAFVGILLTYSLDLRKKLVLVQAILKRRGAEESKMFKRLHQLHNLRNVLCHYPFEEGKDRVTYDYLNKEGTVFPRAQQHRSLMIRLHTQSLISMMRLRAICTKSYRSCWMQHIQSRRMNCSTLLPSKMQSVRLTMSCGFQKSPN